MEVLPRRQSVDSIASAASSRGRSRVWTDEMQKTWQQPVIAAEGFEDRFARYCHYFSLTETQLSGVYADIFSEIDLGCREHLNVLRAGVETYVPKSSLKMHDTCITKKPSGDEKGVAYALEFSGAALRGVRCKLEGNGQIITTEQRLNLRDVKTDQPKGLLDKACGALPLFDCLAKLTADLIEKSGDKDKKEIKVGFAIGFNCDIRYPMTGIVTELSKGFETGRETDDPLEGLDFVTLLDMAYWRNNVNAKVAAVANDAASSLISCCYEKPSRLPPCKVAFLIGVGLGAAYVEPKWHLFGYKGCVVNTELGGFDKLLPVTDVDLEVDFADEGNHGRQIFEKMIAGAYLGEICRRLIVKVWRDEAPQLAWARQSLPTTAAALVVSDDSAELSLAERLLKGLWNWETDRPTRERIQRLFSLVFERSAGLAAAAIAALARRSGRLQPAMGGVTVAVEGGLHISHTWYSDNVRRFLSQLLGPHISQFIHLYVNNDGAGKGAAILSLLK